MIRRQFLGSGTQLLPALADEIVASAGSDLDLQGNMVVLPTSRARRKFERLLLDRVQHPAVLIPPEILTPARLLDRLVVPTKRLASPMASAAGWTWAVEQLELEHRKSLVGHESPLSPSESDALAVRLARLTRELASHNLTPKDVPARCEAMSLPTDAQVWMAIAAAWSLMLEWIDQRGLMDRDACQHAALKDAKLRINGIENVLVVGVDLPGRVVECLESLASRNINVTVIVHDTGDEHDEAWNEWGIVEPSLWMHRAISIPGDQISACSTVDDQSDAVLDALASLGSVEAANVRVVAPDPDLRRSFLAISESEGVPVDCWEGDPSTSTRLGHLIQLLVAFAESPTAASTGELLRHPDIEMWIERLGVSQPIALWDNIWARHAPDDLTQLEMVVEKKAAKTLLSHLTELASRLAGKQPLSQWAGSLMAILVDVLEGAELDDISDTVLDQIHALLTELHELPPEDGNWTAATALRLLVRGLADQTASTKDSTGGVEVIGWLDAHLDDAPNLVVMGMNEGVIPSSPGVDPWLPEPHRAALGLDCRERRVARDAYLLAGIIASGRHAQLICARSSNNGEPLSPSGLLLREQGAPLARRVLQFVGEEGEAQNGSAAYRHGDHSEDTAFDDAPLPQGEPDINSMAVTSFRAFIDDPYAFLLSRDRRIRANEVQTRFELDAMQFGTLVHDVLEHWGAAELASGKTSCDLDKIEHDLHAALDTHVLKRFGESPLPMVRLQAEMARRRLSIFASKQAARALEGWQIHAVEMSFGNARHNDHPAVMYPDKSGLLLLGTIDRIDHHEAFGYQALDYKTGKTAKGAKASHWTSRRGWIDLQLPLYRALLRSIGIDVPASGLGYILIPAAGDDCGFDIASWTDADLVEAEDEAAEIVRIITEGELLAHIEDSFA